jgi:hypothetical protein
LFEWFCHFKMESNVGSYRMAFKFKHLVLTLACLTGMVMTPVWAQTPKNSDAATHAFGASKPIQGRYIVVFTADVRNPAQEAANVLRGANATLHHTFNNALKGFAASISAAALPALQNNPLIDYIEQDQSVSLKQTVSPQMGATWGLDRIDQASLPLTANTSSMAQAQAQPRSSSTPASAQTMWNSRAGSCRATTWWPMPMAPMTATATAHTCRAPWVAAPGAWPKA